MAKKIFDILPPKELEKKELPPEEFPPTKKFKLKISLPQIKIPHFSDLLKIKLKSGLFFILLILILAVAFCFRISKIEIKIWPETEVVNFKTKIIVDKETESSDPAFWIKSGILPGKIFEAEKTISEEFSSSGKVLEKAEGTIRLYNSFSTQPETWLAGTRFVSAEGKLFKSKNKILVPGAEIKNEKMTPTFVDVPVIAAESGPEYNIGPSRFSIVAFRGTARYTKFYGESFEAMTGGGEFPQVKKEDLENAEKILVEKAKLEVDKVLKEKIPAEFLFSQEIVETKILEKSSLVQPGVPIEKFTFQVKAKSSILAFKKEDIDNFALKFILSQIPEEKNIFQKSLKVEYFLEKPLKLESGQLPLSLNFSAKIYLKIDLISLKKGLIGKSLVETKIFLENQSEIIRTEVRFFPLWTKNVPKDIEKIEIQYPLVD